MKVRQQRPGPEQEIKEYVKKNLSMHEYPRIIEFVEDFPKTPKGNIKKHELLQRSMKMMESPKVQKSGNPKE